MRWRGTFWRSERSNTYAFQLVACWEGVVTDRDKACPFCCNGCAKLVSQALLEHWKATPGSAAAGLMRLEGYQRKPSSTMAPVQASAALQLWAESLCSGQGNNATALARWRTMIFGSTAKVLAECKLKYYRISECGAPLPLRQDASQLMTLSCRGTPCSRPLAISKMFWKPLVCGMHCLSHVCTADFCSQHHSCRLT